MPVLHLRRLRNRSHSHYIRQQRSHFDTIPLGHPLGGYLPLTPRFCLLSFVFFDLLRMVPFIDLTFARLPSNAHATVFCTCLTFSYHDRLHSIAHARCLCADAHPRIVIPYYSPFSFGFLVSNDAFHYTIQPGRDLSSL